MDISRFKSLKDIHEYYAVHNKCQLKTSATQPVYEFNPPSSGLIFVGEAPGANEDKQGKPFVGAAGELLDTLLESINLKRSEVYVTNVVKYRPPQNREPLPEEKNACRVWLNAELIYIKPKLIIPLGKHSLERFVPGLRISSAHGQAYEHASGIPIFAMYHPAVALYNPQLKEVLTNDFQRLRKFLDGKIQLNKLDSEPKAKQSEYSEEKTSLVKDILDL